MLVLQHCPPQRFFALLTLGLLLFLTTTEPVRRFLAQLGRVRAGPAAAPVPEAGSPRAVAGPGDAAAGRPAAELEGGETRLVGKTTAQTESGYQ